MAKFSGVIGYGARTETSPGVFEDVITEKSYFGDVVKNTRKLREGEQVNDDILVQNSISIVADAYATLNFVNIRYIRWNGVNWRVSDVEVQRPRLLLRLGEVYNGHTA